MSAVVPLSPTVSGSNRFEVNGAAAARSFVEERGISPRRAQLIWDLVALNSTTSIALHKEPEVALGTMGIGLDYGGFFFERVPSTDMTEVLRAFPRLKMKTKFTETCSRLVSTKPAAERHGSLDVQLIERVSVTVAYRDNGARRLDAAAGCEFLDDGIRFEDDPLSSM